MASKVNTRFVIILAAGLVVLVGGVAALALYVSSRSGASYVAKGDAEMAKGDYEAAEAFYSIAVNKEQQNVPWLLKWREALTKKVPPNKVVFGDDFRMYLTANRALAVAKKTDVAAHRDYLDILLNATLSAGGSREAWNSLRTEADASIRYFEGSDGTAWHVLRRYRGLGAMAMDAARMEITERDVEAGKADLETALVVDPGDSASAIALSEYYRRRSSEAAQKRDPAGQKSLLGVGHQVLTDALAANPSDPDLVLARLAEQIQGAVAGVDVNLPPIEQQTRQAAVVRALAPALDAATATLRSADTSKIGLSQVSRFLGLADLIDPATAPERTQELVDRALADRPGAADLIYFKGRLLALRDQPDAAIAQFQKAIDLPRPNVGFDGIKQYYLVEQALFWQANTALLRVKPSGEGREQEKAIAEAVRFRDRLEQEVAKTSPELKFIDAKLAIARHDYALAQKNLDEYSRATGDAGQQGLEALVLGAQVAERLNIAGRAAELYERALMVRPGYIPVMMARANILHSLGQLKDASDLYRQVVQMDPGNTTAAQQLDILRALQSEQTPELADPVINALVQAQRLQYPTGGRPGDDKAAEDVLRKAAAENNSDPRLAGALASLLATRNDLGGAAAVVSEALKAHPDSADLKAMQHRLQLGDSLEGALALAEEGGKTPLDKTLNRYAVYRARKMPAESKKVLTEAAALPGAMDDGRVVEALFLNALESNDQAEASRLADLAVAKNIDLAEGLTFRARLQITQGKFAEAGTTLQQALDKRGAHPAVYRLLGDVQMRLGRPHQAIEQYRSAQRMNPTDPETVRALLMALASTQQNVEALRVARDAAPFLPNDLLFANMRLSLEALVGSREAAVSGREQLLARFPDDEDNAATLVQLYLEGRQWPKARALLDTLRAKMDSINLVGLDARWYAEQGNIEGGKVVWRKYMDSQQSARDPNPYLGYSQFLLQRGDPGAALAVLEEGRAKQDPKKPVVDLAKADVLFNAGEYEQAASTYQSIIAAGAPDPEFAVHSRMIEAYLNLGDLDAAGKALAGIGAPAESNLTLLALKAGLAERRGDRVAARETLDRAAEKFPDDPMPFFRRGVLLSGDPAFEADALADLDTAIRLRPSHWQALQARALLNLARGRKNEALADLRTAVETNPYQDPVRLAYIAQLIAEKRQPDAIQVGRDAVRIRPNDIALAGGLADLFARSGIWDAASVFFGQIWNLTHDPRHAGPYILSLTRSNQLPQAEAVAAALGPAVDSSAALLMARAELRQQQKNDDGMARDIMSAYARSGEDPRSLAAWYQQLNGIVTDPAIRIQIFDRVAPNPKTAEWHQSMRADALTLIPARRAEGITVAEGLLRSTVDSNLKLSLARMLQSVYSADKNYEKAAQACKDGLAVVPGDVMLNNNLASYLTANLNRAPEAVPHAEAAAKGAADNHAVLDTLAAAYAGAGRTPEAIDTYERAAQVSPDAATSSGYLLKGAKLALGSADKARARKLAGLIRSMSRQGTNILSPEQTKELEEYERQAGR